MCVEGGCHRALGFEFFFKDLFISILYVPVFCHHICVCVCACAHHEPVVASEAGREYWMIVSHQVGARNPIQVLCMNSNS